MNLNFISLIEVVTSQIQYVFSKWKSGGRQTENKIEIVSFRSDLSSSRKSPKFALDLIKSDRKKPILSDLLLALRFSSKFEIDRIRSNLILPTPVLNRDFPIKSTNAYSHRDLTLIKSVAIICVFGLRID